MANVKNEVQEKYLLYAQFKKKVESLDKEDQAVLNPYLTKLFHSWNEAIHNKAEEERKRRLQ
jgi:hypothetical protein